MSGEVAEICAMICPVDVFDTASMRRVRFVEKWPAATCFSRCNVCSDRAGWALQALHSGGAPDPPEMAEAEGGLGFQPIPHRAVEPDMREADAGNGSRAGSAQSPIRS